jgi:hypothetical protein
MATAARERVSLPEPRFAVAIRKHSRGALVQRLPLPPNFLIRTTLVRVTKRYSVLFRGKFKDAFEEYLENRRNRAPLTLAIADGAPPAHWYAMPIALRWRFW